MGYCSLLPVLLLCLHTIFLGFFAGPTVEQQAEMARTGGRTLAALQPEQVTEQYGQIVNNVHVWQVLQHRLIT